MLFMYCAIIHTHVHDITEIMFDAVILLSACPQMFAFIIINIIYFIYVLFCIFYRCENDFDQIAAVYEPGPLFKLFFLSECVEQFKLLSRKLHLYDDWFIYEGRLTFFSFIFFDN